MDVRNVNIKELKLLLPRSPPLQKTILRAAQLFCTVPKNVPFHAELKMNALKWKYRYLLGISESQTQE